MATPIDSAPVMNQNQTNIDAADVAPPAPPPRLSSDAALLSQGAEARLYTTRFLHKPAIIKQRFKKHYRHPILDEKLTSSRLKGEVRHMVRARRLGVRTPVVYHVDREALTITMEHVLGHSVKEVLFQNLLSSDDLDQLLASIGQSVAAMHDGNIVHGDLTTSNLLVKTQVKVDEALVVIDFGLSYVSTNAEDKGVDLYVMERAFLSAHSRQPGLFDKVMASYKKHSKHHAQTLARYAEVRLRGRKRTMVG